MHGAEISRDLLLTFAPSIPSRYSWCWAALLSLFCTLHSWFYHKPSPHQYTLIVQCQDNFWLTTFMLFHVSTNLMFKTILYLPLKDPYPSTDQPMLQVRKLQDKVSKCQDNVKKCREQYEIAVSDITNYNSRYQEVRFISDTRWFYAFQILTHETVKLNRKWTHFTNMFLVSGHDWRVW